MYFTPLLAALALCPLAQGLRTPPPETATALVEEDDEEVRLPGIENFTADWMGMTKTSLYGPVQWTWKVQLILGVFSTAEDEKYRNVIRHTWMRQRGVCRPGFGPELGCSVYVVFAVGNSGNSSVENIGLTSDRQWANFPDILQLNTSENKNRGKSFTYFREVVKRYPWATHYAKMDSDVFPDLDAIVKSIRETRPGCEAYLGKPWACLHLRHCPPASCGPPQGGDLLRFNPSHTEHEHCWTYMQGGLYILSKKLAEKVVERDGWWVHHQNGTEDVTTGMAVDHVTSKGEMCVDTWRKEMVSGNAGFYHERQGLPIISVEWSRFYR